MWKAPGSGYAGEDSCCRRKKTSPGKHKRSVPGNSQIDGLTEHVGNRSVVRIVIIAVQCQHASCHLVHDIVGWCSQNDISGKSLRKLSLGAKQLFKIFQLRPGRKRTEDQQICDFLRCKVLQCQKISSF